MLHSLLGLGDPQLECAVHEQDDYLRESRKEITISDFKLLKAKHFVEMATVIPTLEYP